MKSNSNRKFWFIKGIAILLIGGICFTILSGLIPVALVMILAPINIFLEKIGIDEETAMFASILFLIIGLPYIFGVYDKIQKPIRIGIKRLTNKQIKTLIINIVLILIGSIVIAWILPKSGNIFFDGLEYVYNIFYYHFYLGDTLSFLLTILTVFIGIPYVIYRFYRLFKKEQKEEIKK